MAVPSGAVVAHQRWVGRAFPGAEGYGRLSVGGRGGTVIKVTNLNDTGAGSFRAALAASGSRIVVFTVSGVINLLSDLYLTNGYITIAGQTSPGGICTAGGQVWICAPHVIVRHVRFKTGYHVAQENQHGLMIAGNDGGQTAPGADHVIIDHCSIAWGCDETLGMSYSPQNVTVQWSIVSYGLAYAKYYPVNSQHSKGTLISGQYSDVEGTISFHHNYIAHCADRVPQIATKNGAATDTGPLVDFVNNVIYHWFSGNLPNLDNDGKVNWVHNYLKGSTHDAYFPSSAANATWIFKVGVSAGYEMAPRVYVEGNITANGLRNTQDMDEWIVKDWNTGVLANEGYRALTRWEAPAITTDTASAAMAATILETVGAHATPAGPLTMRDANDTEAIADFATGEGHVKWLTTYPDDWAALNLDTDAVAPADTDGDGIPDAYAAANPSDTIEDYLNSLCG